MNELKWVIQSNKIKISQILPLVSSLREYNIPFIDVSVDAFQDCVKEIGDFVGDNFIPYGSTHLIKLASEAKWKHVWYDEHNFNVNTWVKNTRMLNSDADIITLETLANLSTSIKNNIFIRPIGDLKTFTGQILQSHDIYSFVDGLIKRGIPHDTNVSLSGVKNILAEWRYFIVDGVIITGSTYRIDNKVVWRNESDSEILSKAQKLADKWLPNRCCCMDVAKTSKGFDIIEFNCLNASGFYDHDIIKFANSVTDYAKNPLTY